MSQRTLLNFFRKSAEVAAADAPDGGASGGQEVGMKETQGTAPKRKAQADPKAVDTAGPTLKRKLSAPEVPLLPPSTIKT